MEEFRCYFCIQWQIHEYKKIFGVGVAYKQLDMNTVYTQHTMNQSAVTINVSQMINVHIFTQFMPLHTHTYVTFVNVSVLQLYLLLNIEDTNLTIFYCLSRNLDKWKQV